MDLSCLLIFVYQNLADVILKTEPKSPEASALGRIAGFLLVSAGLSTTNHRDPEKVDFSHLASTRFVLQEFWILCVAFT